MTVHCPPCSQIQSHCPGCTSTLAHIVSGRGFSHSSAGLFQITLSWRVNSVFLTPPPPPSSESNFASPQNLHQAYVQILANHSILVGHNPCCIHFANATMENNNKYENYTPEDHEEAPRKRKRRAAALGGKEPAARQLPQVRLLQDINKITSAMRKVSQHLKGAQMDKSMLLRVIHCALQLQWE